MRLSLVLIFSGLAFFCHAQTFDLFVGTYTSTGSKGIYVYRFNTLTGNAYLVSNTDSITNPSYLTITRDGKYVYAVNETGGEAPGRVSAFRYNRQTGKLSFLNSQLTGGDDPCYVSVSKNNKHVVVANYSGGSVSAFRVKDDGMLTSYTQLIQDSGTSLNKTRQEKAHVHSAIFSPDERYLFTPDLGIDKVMIYVFNELREQPLTPANPSFTTSPGGSGPRHFIFSINKKFAYLAEELSGTVGVFSYNNGTLKLVQRLITHPKNYKGEIGTADIHFSPDGKFLYVSNRGDKNTITIFFADNVTGKLRLKGYQSTMGKTPRNFMIDPTGSYLLVANQNSDNIVIFKRNKQTGLLKPTGKELSIPKPVCLQMISQ